MCHTPTIYFTARNKSLLKGLSRLSFNEASRSYERRCRPLCRCFAQWMSSLAQLKSLRDAYQINRGYKTWKSVTAEQLASYLIKTACWIDVCQYSSRTTHPPKRITGQCIWWSVLKALTRTQALYLVSSELKVMCLKAAPWHEKQINNAPDVVKMSFWKRII